jgi:hypothetical protein
VATGTTPRWLPGSRSPDEKSPFGFALSCIERLNAASRPALVSRDVGAMGAGPHAVDLANGSRIAPGVYWVRLTQGPSSQISRVAVVD